MACKSYGSELTPNVWPKNDHRRLLHKNLDIKDVVNTIKNNKIEDNIVRKPLPLFMLTLGKSEDIKNLWNFYYFGSKEQPLSSIQKISSIWAYAILLLFVKLRNSAKRNVQTVVDRTQQFGGCIIAKEFQKGKRKLYMTNKYPQLHSNLLSY